jgi:N4-gp56 family major capsid protein
MTTRYSDAAISPRTNVYAERQMLKHAMPVMVLEKLALSKQMPKNKTDTIKFRRPKVFSAATTPLVEGVTPSTTQFQYEDVSTSLKQYGMVIEVTDVIEDLAEDPVLNDASLQAGENIGRTMEALNYGVVRAGTGVTYHNGAARSDVNTVITLAKQRSVIRTLKSNKAQKITRILSASTGYGTSAIEAAFVAVGHTDLESDIRSLAGFVPVAEYGQRSTLCAEEIGSVEDVRYILSPDLEPWADAGGNKGSTVSTSGTKSDVYPVIYFGQDAWAQVALRGQGAVSPSIIPVGQKTKDDPLGQRGYVGWKAWHAALILNQAWMHRLEVATTAL